MWKFYVIWSSPKIQIAQYWENKEANWLFFLAFSRVQDWVAWSQMCCWWALSQTGAVTHLVLHTATSESCSEYEASKENPLDEHLSLLRLTSCVSEMHLICSMEYAYWGRRRDWTSLVHLGHTVRAFSWISVHLSASFHILRTVAEELVCNKCPKSLLTTVNEAFDGGSEGINTVSTRSTTSTTCKFIKSQIMSY